MKQINWNRVRRCAKGQTEEYFQSLARHLNINVSELKLGITGELK